MTKSLTRLYKVLFLLLVFHSFEERTYASTTYHLIGWINAFVPGSGEILQGNYLLGAVQAPLEIGTFLWGYNLSPRSPMTIDGVPQDLPVVQGRLKTTTSSMRTCVRHNPKTGACSKFSTQTVSSTQQYYDLTPIDATKPAYAELLQEFGIKYHFINVFNAYRDAAAAQGGTEYEGQSIDMRSTGDLFKDPFRFENLSSPWVYVPLLLLTGFTAFDYRNQTIGGQAQPLQPLTSGTNRLIALNFIGAQPFGSGAPEEAFYRGFLQNEAYHAVASPYFSIPVSAAAFSFSHAPEGRLTAAVAGTYLGFLAHKNHGKLAEGIALHFWGVVVLGIETYLLTKYSQGLSAPIESGASFSF